MLKPMEEKIISILGDKVYGRGIDNSMENVVVQLLRDKKLKVTCAESCTGGMVAEKITSVPGASECFDCGYVTYSNEQKDRAFGSERRNT